jgi:hypothetical protein
MGWWRSGRHPADVLGDGPADVLQQELDRLAGTEETKPTFQALIDALAAVLRDDARDLVEPADAYTGEPIVARFEPPASTLRSAPSDRNVQVQSALASALKRIAAEYELEQSRKPTLGEILGTIAFVLRVRPERYVSNPDGRTLADLANDQ